MNQAEVFQGQRLNLRESAWDFQTEYIEIFFFFLEYCKVNSQPRLFVAKILFAKSKPAGLLRCFNLIANCCHGKVKKKQLENAKEE